MKKTTIKYGLISLVVIFALAGFFIGNDKPENNIATRGKITKYAEMKNYEGDTRMPLGKEVEGVTLGGHLAGKKMYYLNDTINTPYCWVDSPHWTGEKLYYGISSIHVSDLLSGAMYRDETNCVLPEGQVNGEFDIYEATLQDDDWSIKGVSAVNTEESEAGMSISGDTMAYVRYYLDPGSWDIFFSTKHDGVWSESTPFELNTVCREDNPELFDDGNKIIYESSMLDAETEECGYNMDDRKLWYSEKINDKWADPVLVDGEPNYSEKNTQPWVDELNNYLYWSDDMGCGCVKRVPFENGKVLGESEAIVTPDISGLVRGTSDGKVVFVGEYSESNGYAFMACATTEGEGEFMSKYHIDINTCVIPLEE